MPVCGIKEKNKPTCAEALFKRERKLYCPVHCRAKTSRGHCKRHHSTGGVRCDLHGGKSLKGLAHPQLSTGKRSRYIGVLSPEMGTRFESQQSVVQKLSLMPEINLLDARVETLLARMTSGDSIAGMKEALAQYEKFVQAQVDKDRPVAIKALQELGLLLRQGSHAEDDWEKVEELAYTKRPRLVDSEIKRQLALSEIVHRAFVMKLMQTIVEGVKRRVQELPQGNEIIIGVQSDVRRLVGGSGGTDVQLAGDGD